MTITATSPEDDNIFGENDEITFIGTFAKKTFETEDRSILFLGAQNMLYWPQPIGESIPNIGAFRAYFQLNGITAGDLPVNNVRMFFGDDSETSGIGEAAPLNDKGQMINDIWYSLDGRRMSGKPTKKGVYVNNGRKVVVK